MDTPGVSLYDGGTINFEVLQPSMIEEELEDEDDRQRKLELINDIENELDYEDESYEEHSSQRSINEPNNMSNVQNVEYQNNINYSIPEENQRNRIDSENKVHEELHVEVSPSWTEHSDFSGNFSSQESLIKKSPTHFHLEINQVNSHSDDSPPMYRSQDKKGYIIPNNDQSTEQTNNYEAPNYVKSYENNSRMVLSQGEFLSADHSYGQLQLLYESRGREMDTLSEELNELKISSGQEVLSLKHQISILKAENGTLLISRDQMKLLLSENEGRIRSISIDLKEKNKKLEAFLIDNKKLKHKIDILEDTISSLELQISELQSADSLARSRQVHEEFLQKLQSSHQEEVGDLKQKLKSMSNRAETAEERIKKLEVDIVENRKLKDKVLHEKAEVINNLNASLVAAQQQLKILLPIKSRKDSVVNEELNELKLQTADLNEKLAQKESLLNQAKSDLETFDMILKMGILKSFLPVDDSLGQLGFRKTLTFDDTTTEPHTQRNSIKKTSQDNFNISDNMKQELLKSLISNKKYRQEIQKLNENISEKQKQLQITLSELKSSREEIKESKNKISLESKPNMHALIEENTALKKELSVLKQQINIIKDTGENMASLFQDFQNSAKNSSSAEDKNMTLSLLTKAINDYVKVLQNFSLNQQQTWEELKMENLKLSSKRYLIESHFENLLEYLNELKYELRTKRPIDSTDLNEMYRLLNDFTNNVKDISEDATRFNEENLQLRNQLWTLRLELEKTNEINAIIKKQKEMLEKEKNDIEIEKFQTIERCKENYMKFHEESVLKVKEELESAYLQVVAALKDEINRISNKLMEVQENYMKICHEKNNLEEIYKNNLPKNESNHLINNEILCTARYVKENEDLRKDLESCKESLLNLEKNYNKNLETLTVELNKRSNIELVDKYTSTDDEELQLSNVSNEVQLKDEVARWENKYIKMKSEYMEDKLAYEEQLTAFRTQIEHLNKENTKPKTNLNGKAETEISEGETFNLFTETTEKFKRMNLILKEEKENLVCYYEKQVKDMQNQLDTLSASYANIFAQTIDSAELKYKEEIKVLKSQVKDLSKLIEQLNKEKQNLIAYHEEQIKTLTDELQNLEITVQEIKNSKEVDSHKYNKIIQELGCEIYKYKGEVTATGKKVTKWGKKYSNLKAKFFKQQKNFDKLRSGTEERINYYRDAAERISANRLKERQAQYEDFKLWLEKTRLALTDRISKLIEGLKSIPERSIPSSVLEPHLNALYAIYKTLEKLDIKE